MGKQPSHRDHSDPATKERNPELGIKTTSPDGRRTPTCAFVDRKLSGDALLRAAAATGSIPGYGAAQFGRATRNQEIRLSGQRASLTAGYIGMGLARIERMTLSVNRFGLRSPVFA
jgi:hypothetical protein